MREMDGSKLNLKKKKKKIQNISRPAHNFKKLPLP